MSDSNRRSKGATILIIENDDATVSDLQNELIGAGYAVRWVTSGKEALVTLSSAQADLILMGLLLPDTDGLILCSTLKAHFQVPIIILGARAGDVDRALAMESGAIECITRPIQYDELLLLIKAVVHSPVPAQA